MRVLGTCVLALLAFAACGDDGPTPASAADTLVRERAAAFFATNDGYDRARTELAPLVLRSRPAVEDLIAAAAVEFAEAQFAPAEAFLARAARLDGRSAAVGYLRGQIARESGDFERARSFLSAAHAQDPADLPTRIALAEVENELGDTARAEDLYRSVIDVGVENGGPWYITAVYRTAALLTQLGREDEAGRFNALWRGLEARGFRTVDAQTLRLGILGRLRPPQPAGSASDARAAATFRARALELPELAAARELLANDLNGDQRADLTAVGPRGLVVALANDAGWVVQSVVAGPIESALPFDIDNDNDLDFLVLHGGVLEFYACNEGRWALTPLTLPKLASPPRQIVAVDYDHEGDLDLLLVGDFGARVWRNDGAAVPDKGGAYVDGSDVATLPADRAFTWCVCEDFDGDNDVDFLLGGSQGVYLADSLRAGRFADRTSVFPAGARIAEIPIVADLDGDDRPDIWTPEAVWYQRPDNSFERRARSRSARAAMSHPTALDLDLDGALDLVGRRGDGRTAVLFAAGQEHEIEGDLATDVAAQGDGALAAADFDGDHRVDVALAAADGVRILVGNPTASRGKSIAYGGLRDNRRAIGAIVEYRAARIYRRIYWRGEPQILGVGSATKIDVLRITWPNGTVQTDLDVDLEPESHVDDPSAAFGAILQPSSQSGSCPFLYTWNGERYVFVTDVLGITPLGLPIAPGQMVPPDHDEYVLVRGDQLAPQDGFYDVQFTEELREVTYLDRAELLVVDHPSDTEIFPNERFTFPPFPEAHIHTVRAPLAPEHAIDVHGRDWAAELRAADDVYATPFELLPAQFAGLTAPWYVELSFDKARVTEGHKLRLLMTGWFYWSDASANMAAARQPGIAFVPPLLQIPDGQGGWRDSGPPVGFPAGKTKTMVIDVSDILRRDDPRVRVFTTLRLYWDAIRLATDADDGERRVQRLEPASARLWQRGFSAPLAPSDTRDRSEHRPERFDWTQLALSPRWNQHPGLYTRYGETVPLLAAVDDMFDVLGAGDALHVRFDARSVAPPPAGFVRDFLVYLDGWAKDRDPNTLDALEVEPLPFHAMSGYPYRADEHFPDSEAHRAWRKEWNQRPARRWIAPVCPARARDER